MRRLIIPLFRYLFRYSVTEAADMNNTSTARSLASALRNISIFAALDDAALQAITPQFSQRQIKRGQIVIKHDDGGGEVFFILEGAFRATMYSPGGREISYQDLHAGDMFGELAAIDGLPRSTHVIALEKASLAVLSRAAFNNVLVQYPEVAQATLKKMAALVRFLCDRIYGFGALDVNHRIRAELLRLAQPCEPASAGVHQRAVISRLPTHQELANRLATHREAISREISSLEKTGLIQKDKRAIISRADIKISRF